MGKQPDNRELKDRLQAFKKKYYLNKILRGSILFIAFLLTTFLLINSIEFSARLNTTGRSILFFSYIGLVILSFIYLIGQYLPLIYKNKKQLSNEEAAAQIGKFFPEISDKLLNVIQLEKLSDQQNDLLTASIKQKTNAIKDIPFAKAIDYGKNRKFLKYLLWPGTVVILLLIFLPKFITESSTRIVQYNHEFIPEAPFRFTIEKKELRAFKGEDFTIQVKTEGSAVPQSLYVWNNNRKVKAQSVEPAVFSYTFRRLQQNTSFIIEAENITSREYEIEVVERPSIDLFTIELDFPKYLGLNPKLVENSGNLEIPEGTAVHWNFQTKSTDHLSMKFHQLNENADSEKQDGQNFRITKTFLESTDYSISLQNEYSRNKDSLTFAIQTIKDKYPEISFNQFQDTVLFKSLVLAGNIADDYGFSSLDFYFKYNTEKEYQKLPLNYRKELDNQSYYYDFPLDADKIKAGAELSYYVQVTDNDGVNGFKSSKTSTYSFKIPSAEEMEETLEKSSQVVEKQIDETLKSAQELNEKITEAEEKLKTKKEMNWQDEKLIQDILKQKEEIQEKLETLQKENRQNNLKQELFNPQDEKLKEKVQQLQELMDEMLDDETKKLYEELRELLENQMDISDFQEKIEDIKNQESNLEEELERTLELFKKLKFEMKLEENIQDLEKEIADQEKLMEESGNRKNDKESLSEEQEQEKADMETLEKQMEELNELNKERENPDALPEDMKEMLEEIQQEQQNAKEQLDNNRRKKAQESQKKAIQKMKQMQENLQAMQNSLEMQQMQENLDFLRDLVDNLVRLSFNQESLMNEFKEIKQSDPRFVALSQEQLKLKDDSQIIQDSLISLSKRVFQISSFVTREVSEMNRQMDESLKALKERKLGEATGKQQFTMTSINNLALLLDDVLQQMQQQMAQQMGQGKGKKGQKNMPSLSQLQKQLSQQIQELKRSGKTGRALSEELARLAAQQEKIRNALENFETGMDQDNLGDKINELIQQMEENEIDLINKNITEKTVERQQEILTRLLEAENAMQEREQEEERKAKTAFDYKISVPESVNEYLKAREKEIELLKTIPAKLNPYYKKEANKYFNKIKEKN